VPALASARAGYEIIAAVGVDAIREKSLRLTRRMIEHAMARGWRVNTPLDDEVRGGSVIIDVPDAERLTAELLERQVIVDFRPGAGIRMAPHFYNSDDDVSRALAELDALVGSS
jgi:kynureninase